MPPHLCHAIDCNERVRPDRLMCARHWYSVPADLKREVWRTYRPGQEIDKDPDQPYIEAAKNAINWVARKEGKPELPTTASIRKTLEDLVAKTKNSPPSP
jgi:hypothetical protein